MKTVYSLKELTAPATEVPESSSRSHCRWPVCRGWYAARAYLCNMSVLIMIDNTNADPETREHWINLAKELKIPIRCIYFPASPELCRHNNAVRAANRDLVCLFCKPLLCWPATNKVCRTPNPAPLSPASPLGISPGGSASLRPPRDSRTWFASSFGSAGMNRPGGYGDSTGSESVRVVYGLRLLLESSSV